MEDQRPKCCCCCCYFKWVTATYRLLTIFRIWGSYLQGWAKFPKRKCAEEKLGCLLHFWRFHLQDLHDYLQGHHCDQATLLWPYLKKVWKSGVSKQKSKGPPSPLQVANSGCLEKSPTLVLLADTLPPNVNFASRVKTYQWEKSDF